MDVFLSPSETEKKISQGWVVVCKWVCLCHGAGCPVCHQVGRGVTLRSGTEMLFGTREQVEPNGHIDWVVDADKSVTLLVQSHEGSVGIEINTNQIPQLLTMFAQAFNSTTSFGYAKAMPARVDFWRKAAQSFIDESVA